MWRIEDIRDLDVVLSQTFVLSFQLVVIFYHPFLQSGQVIGDLLHAVQGRLLHRSGFRARDLVHSDLGTCNVEETMRWDRRSAIP